MRRLGVLALALVALAGCWPFGHGRNRRRRHRCWPTRPGRSTRSGRWGSAQFNSGHWADARKAFDRVGTGLPATDPRYSRLRFFQGEIELAQGNELDAVRIFRRIADETPQTRSPPMRCFGPAMPTRPSGGGPELDPTYGQTALGVYQEVIARYPDARTPPSGPSSA